ncbi:outer-membrane lipoprotein carrier protein [Hypericibacter adhaerens]|uniref:Outer-membrane lipoprotein carrier protein n=1 Tax=Hypericibacter adhaerens TaxID=2602016 RepID=A0A5J6N6I1_9PROT|nr:outer membrane lipoprotein carrier protein LolA [Hypericibacter adhaerens]QEX25157.1 outer-membrane lipoprotein carrier protein [Hypericibacter adhaerens]
MRQVFAGTPADATPTRREVLKTLGALPLIAAGASSLWSVPAAAATPSAKELTGQDRADLKRAADYLNGITTMRAKFQQYSNTAGLAFGKIYLRRPGRLRVEYDPPLKVIIVADGLVVSYYDQELDQISQVPIGSSPLWFLLRETVSFSNGVTVSDLQRQPGSLRVSAFESGSPEAGQIELLFADNPIELRQWTILDPQGNQIRVGLQDVTLGGALANALFATPSKSTPGENR